jgi:3-dehydroquinate synthase
VIPFSPTTYEVGQNLDFSRLFFQKLQGDVLLVTEEYFKDFAQSFGTQGRKFQLFQIPSGESAKSWKVVESIISFLIEHQFSRQSVLVALGGGTVSDVVGFVASIFLRGVPFVVIPTTLLAQADAAIGGKTAINHPLGKNLIGTFHAPQAVWIDVQFLTSLTDEAFLSGLAEVLKHAFIGDGDMPGERDIPFFDFLRQNRQKILARDLETLTEMVRRSCAIKRHIVESDPFEQHTRTFLNFGHTLGHAIEQLSDYTTPHGLAVSVGMRFALFLSSRVGTLSEFHRLELEAFLESFGLPKSLSDLKLSFSLDALIRTMKRDKKNCSTAVRFVILKAQGQPEIVSIPVQTLEHELEVFNARVI